MERTMACFGVESTAHTFSCAVVKTEGEEYGGRILSDIRHVHEPPAGSGIHPREASRHHVEHAAKVVRKALEESDMSMGDVDCVAFSMGPGLGPCLRIGAVVARSLAHYHRKPLVPVNHAVGHIELAILLTEARDPVVLLVSGGHTMVVAFAEKRWRIFGETLDLTIGQLFDQFGREAGFSSPCGPRLENLAANSDRYIPFPYSVKGNDVSLSGLLTASKRLLHAGEKLEDLCFSIQETGYAMLAEVTERALAFTEKKEVLITGGVAANRRLQEMLNDVCARHGATLHVIPRRYSGDCGAQIAWTGLLAYRTGVTVEVEKSRVRQSWRLDQVDVPWRS